MLHGADGGGGGTTYHDVMLQILPVTVSSLLFSLDFTSSSPVSPPVSAQLTHQISDQQKLCSGFNSKHKNINIKRKNQMEHNKVNETDDVNHLTALII